MIYIYIFSYFSNNKINENIQFSSIIIFLIKNNYDIYFSFDLKYAQEKIIYNDIIISCILKSYYKSSECKK